MARVALATVAWLFVIASCAIPVGDRGMAAVSDSTGSRSFAVNQDNIIWQRAGKTAPSEPFGPPAVPVQ